MKKQNKQPGLIVWVVEDEASAAREATEAVLGEAGEAGLKVDVYWDKEILWDSLLSGPPPAEYRPEFEKTEHLPAVVILDLFTGDGFLAERYFRKLRQVEGTDLPRSRVILWSVYTSFADAQDLLFVEPLRDRKLMFTSSKTMPVLREKLTRCFRSWKEERFE